MEMRNFTPFPNLRFSNTDNTGAEFGVLIVKGTYRLDELGALVVAEEQAPLLLTDTYHGEPNSSALWLPSDLVPRKPRADVIVNAVARAPHGKPVASWICGVRIVGEHVLEKRLRVTGPRAWRPVWNLSERARSSLTEAERQRVFGGWTLGDPAPVTEVPIRYEAAYGGILERRNPDGSRTVSDAYEYNPIGCGWIDREMTDRGDPVPAPQIEDVAVPIREPMHHHEPAGFGPIPPAWLPRRPLGGTFDEHWKEQIWPNWPADYSFAYHNSAHPALIYPQMLEGDEIISLQGLHLAGETILRLPGHRLLMQLRVGGRVAAPIPMDLDTLVLDIADADPAEHRVFLTWRTTFDPEVPESIAFGFSKRAPTERERNDVSIQHPMRAAS